jgi:cytochrome c-type biogenesis protein CcmH/NrfG
MKGVALSYALAGFVLLALLPSIARAQPASVRGSVVDEQGAPLPGVQVEMEFLGETRQKIVKKLTADKKGVFVRVGVTPGRWRLTFTKEGFKPRGLETDLSYGGVSEIPPVTLSAAPVAPPTSPGTAQPDAGPADATAEIAAVYTKAVAAFNAEDDAQAEALFRQVVEAVPSAGAAHYSLGLLAMKRKDVPGAEAAFRKDIELRPQEPRAYIALATLLGASQRADEGLALLQGVAGSFGENATFQFTLGVAAMNAGHESDALPALEKCAQLDPDNAEAQYYLGTLAMGQNDIQKAVGHLQRYLELAPNGPNAPVTQKLLEALKTRK